MGVAWRYIVVKRNMEAVDNRVVVLVQLTVIVVVVVDDVDMEVA
jgi:hypothetical protein